MLHAQAVARAQAQAASTVVISTIVSLVTSAFGFVAALAWNSAIQKVLEETVMPNLGGRLGDGGVLVVYALLVTLLAIVVVFLLNRIASRWVKKSAAEAAKADHGLLP
jgi:predicted permease